MADQPKIKKIRIEYDDGSVKESRGDEAEVIMKWWNSCENLAYIHGSQFQGKPLQLVKKPRKKKK